MQPLLPPAELAALRSALTDFTVTGVTELLGVEGLALLARGDHAGVRRQLRRSTDRRADLVRLFVLGDPVDDAAARRALQPLDVDQAGEVLERSGGSVRARVDIRPYSEAGSLTAVSPAGLAEPADGPHWWVVSDFGSDVRPGPLAGDHVLGVGSAALTLAQATVRDHVGRALDVGTGCGVQALHLTRHCDVVTATDISARALRFAATGAALSGVNWDLRQGSLLDPVAGEAFDLIVANPPFVVSPGLSAGRGGHEYRDSGTAGDDVCRRLVTALPSALCPGGVAQLLANWIVPTSGDWTERVAEWLAATDCDAWVWQRELADPAEYVAMWLTDAGHAPGTDGYAQAYDSWLDWFESHGVAAVGMGMITLWRPVDGEPVVVVCEDVRQPLEQPIGGAIQPWHRRQRWLARTDDAALMSTRLVADPELVIERADVRTATGWRTAAPRLRQSHGLRWEVDSDEAFVAVVRGCDGSVSMGELTAVLGAALEASPADVADAALPVVRDLVGRGFLVPVAEQGAVGR